MPRDIDLIKTHGTGTKSNNKAEHNALVTVFGKQFMATSFKPTIGHTMGASGLLETCLLLDSLKVGLVPPIKNRTAVDHYQYLSTAAEVDKDIKILSQAAGMGNIYSAAIFDTKV
jgi:3-oxoacyl-(acyl-carrier-protein) synthase